MLALLVLASLVAGFVDAAVGGGGLITIPALMLGLPGVPVTTVLGTNKAVACTGTTVAAGAFLRSRVLSPREVLLPVLSAILGAGLGVALAYVVQGRLARGFEPVLFILLAAMLAFTLLKPGLGRVHAPRFGMAHQRGLACLIALLIGFYDGFFGPGTGSLLIFLFVAVLGFDFLRASALAKSVNWASNLASLVLFVARGSWLPLLALSMAVANGIGGYLGARTALLRGTRWVRILFLGVVGAMLLRLGWRLLA
nr:TSUP family transporter [uncultured Holophaga sp.]